MRPLSDLEVLELPGIPAVGFCGRLFAWSGARVTKVVLRDRGGEPSLSERALAIYLDGRKERAGFDLDETRELAELKSRIAEADVVITSAIPPQLAGFLTPEGCRQNPGLVLVLTTDFGFTGPYAAFRGSSLVDFAASGYLYQYGDPDREPLRGLEFQPYFQAGLHAFLGAMAALHERRRSGLGQRVEASVMQSLAATHEWTIERYTHGGIIQRRAGNRYPVYHPYAMYPTKDGYISLACHDTQRANVLLALAGHPEAVGDPRFESDVGRSVRQAEFDALVLPWLTSKTTAELLDEFEAVRLVAGAVRSLPEVLADAHFEERGVWEEVEVEGRRIRMPGRPVRWLAAHRGPDAPRPPLPPAPPEAGPLAGLRVIDLTRHWAGPHGVRPLGDLGADVIRIEAPWLRGTAPPDEELVRESGFYIDNQAGERYWMRSGAYNNFNYNKRCVALRMDRPAGREVFRRIAASADIVIDNYLTQVWEEFGLDAQSLWAVNPRLVALTMSGHGRTGRFRNRGAFGPQTEALIGADSLMGHADGGPHMSGVAWGDPAAGMYAAAFALVGLWERERTGRGVALESCQVESCLSFIGAEIVRFGLTGEPPSRLGNRHEEHVPHGVYRCRGEDRWLAIAVTSDEEWQNLCRAIGRPDLDRPEFTEAAGRRKEEDLIDRTIGGWTTGRDPREAMEQLQKAGVPSFVVCDSRDLVEDRYLWDTGTIVDVSGEILEGFFLQLSRTPPRVHRPVADVGEHNREVLQEAGYTLDEIERLAAADIIADRPKL